MNNTPKPVIGHAAFYPHGTGLPSSPIDGISAKKLRDMSNITRPDVCRDIVPILKDALRHMATVEGPETYDHGLFERIEEQLFRLTGSRSYK